MGGNDSDEEIGSSDDDEGPALEIHPAADIDVKNADSLPPFMDGEEKATSQGI